MCCRGRLWRDTSGGASFPSGHSLRAAYAAIIFSGPHGPDFGLLGPGGALAGTTAGAWLAADSGLGTWLIGLGSGGGLSAFGNLRTCLLAWAALVAASRVGLGKHFASDVAAGAGIGLAIAASPYPAVDPQGWQRIALASTFTAEIAYIIASAARRAEIKGWPFLLGVVVVFWATFPFAA